MIPSSACRQSPHADQPGRAGNAWRPYLSYTTQRGTIAEHARPVKFPNMLLCAALLVTPSTLSDKLVEPFASRDPDRKLATFVKLADELGPGSTERGLSPEHQSHV
jgi:hypothetical protein